MVASIFVLYISSLCVHPLRYLILPLAGRVVQIGVTPVIVDPLLGLLVHPVQLIGAALHVVPQAQQVALTSTGTGLTEKNKTLKLTTSTFTHDSLDVLEKIKVCQYLTA